jgi:hypothetical protein
MIQRGQSGDEFLTVDIHEKSERLNPELQLHEPTQPRRVHFDDDRQNAWLGSN